MAFWASYLAISRSFTSCASREAVCSSTRRAFLQVPGRRGPLSTKVGIPHIWVAQHLVYGWVGKMLAGLNIENSDPNLSILENPPKELVGPLREPMGVFARRLSLRALPIGALVKAAKAGFP